MQIFVLLSQAKKILPAIEAEILLAYVLDKPREYLIAHPEGRVSSVAYKKLIDLCKKRGKGIPLAYITKRKEFFGLDFYVDERVLIPRPETELLVEEVLSLSKKFVQLTVCDVATGSGCIAIALAKHLPKTRIIATDISKDALAVARKNAKRHNVSNMIKFVQSDLLNTILSFPRKRESITQSRIDSRSRSGMTKDHDLFFDIIVANLPYVARKEALIVEREVSKFEPAEALWAGQDGLRFLRKLLKQVKKLHYKPRYLICEFGFSMKKSLKSLLKSIYGKPRVVFKKDLAGRDRLFILSFPRKRESMLDLSHK